MSNDTPVAMNTFSGQILVSEYHSPIKRTRAPWMSSRMLGQDKMKLEYLGYQKMTYSKKKMEACQKNTRINLKKFPMAKPGTIRIAK